MQICQWISGILVGGGLLAGSVRADIPVTITATIVEPTCSVTEINGGSQAVVDFGVVDLLSVNTAQAQKPLQMKVSCGGAASTGKTLKMQVSAGGQGTMTYGGENVLGTTVTGLGIKLTDKGGASVIPGAWYPVAGVDITQPTPAGNVILTAALVSANPAALTVGGITSSATVVMAYM
ncbi:fimbrial protein [Salmonella enterica subsp. enterica serovar Minnesota]|nr:fimbrial protein [Salmonella enterica subsp. enterica serovar Minnesota]